MNGILNLSSSDSPGVKHAQRVAQTITPPVFIPRESEFVSTLWGLRISAKTGRKPSAQFLNAKRGKCNGKFSRSSSLNLRRKLLTLPSALDGYHTYGVTLTLKRDAYLSKDCPEVAFRRFWDNFCTQIRNFSRRGKLSKHLLSVWRLELTQSGTPHFHTIVCTTWPPDVLIFQGLWIKTVSRFYGYSPSFEVGAQIKVVRSADGAMAYLAAHASKHKREQLGWVGRQWGIIFANKQAKDEWLSLNRSYVSTLNYRSLVDLRRILRRLYARRVDLNRRRRLAFFRSKMSVHFLRNKTLSQIVSLIGGVTSRAFCQSLTKAAN